MYVYVIITLGVYLGSLTLLIWAVLDESSVPEFIITHPVRQGRCAAVPDVSVSLPQESAASSE